MPELDRQALFQPGVVAGVEALPNDVLLRVQVPPSPRFGDPPNVWVCPWHFYHVQNYPKSYLSTISSTSRQYAYLCISRACDPAKNPSCCVFFE